MTRDGVVINLRNPKELTWLSRGREQVRDNTVEYTHSRDDFDPREQVIKRYRATVEDLLISEYQHSEFELSESAMENLVCSLVTSQTVDEHRTSMDEIRPDKSFEKLDTRRQNVCFSIIENNKSLLESLFNPRAEIEQIKSSVESAVVDELGRYQRPDVAHSVAKDVADETPDSQYETLCKSTTANLLEVGADFRKVMKDRREKVANAVIEEVSHIELFDRYFEMAYEPTRTTETAMEDLRSSPLGSEAMHDRYRETIGNPSSIGQSGIRGSAAMKSSTVSSDRSRYEYSEQPNPQPVSEPPEREEDRLYLVHAASEKRRAAIRGLIIEDDNDVINPEIEVSDRTAAIFPVRHSQIGAINSMRPGDHVLFYTADGKYGMRGILGATELAPEFVQRIWDNEDITDRSYIILALNPRRVDIDAGEVSRRLGYNREYPLGVQPVAQHRLQDIRAIYESIESFLEQLHLMQNHN